MSVTYKYVISPRSLHSGQDLQRLYVVVVTLRKCADASAADWLVQSPITWEQLVGFGPAGFDTYARLRFVPDPVRHGQEEADAEVPDDHPSDDAQARQAFKVLQRFTTTTLSWYFCVWDGTGFELPRSIFRKPLLELPHRRYFLAEGNATDAQIWETYFENGSAPAPAFVWPADHAWCFASDIDPHWAGIGGPQPALEALASSGLDIVTASPSDEQPTYY